jgi:hypothetical protein
MAITTLTASFPRSIAGGITAQTAIFGAETPAGAGSFQPYTTEWEPFELTSYDSLVSGSLGPYTPVVSGGRLSFTGAAGAPDGAVLRCNHAGGTVNIAISSPANTRAVASTSELQTVLGLHAAMSGKTVIIRGGITYAITSNDVLRNLTTPVTLRGEVTAPSGLASTNKPVFPAQMMVGAASTTGHSYGKINFENIRWNISVEEFWWYELHEGTNASLPIRPALELRNNNPLSDVQFINCEFIGNAKDAKTGLYPKQKIVSVYVRRCTGTFAIEDSYFDGVHFMSNGEQCNTVKINRNTIRRFHEDGWGGSNTSPDGLGYDYFEFCDNVIYDPIGHHHLHQDYFHFFGGDGFKSGRIRGNICFPGYEGHVTPGKNDLFDGATNSIRRDQPVSSDYKTSNFTYTEAGVGDRMIFLNGCSMTLPAANTLSVTRRTQVIFWAPNGGVNANTKIVFPSNITWQGQSVSEIVMDVPWMCVNILGNPTTGTWTAGEGGPTYQGFFTNSSPDGYRDCDVDANILYVHHPNAIRFDGVNGANMRVFNTTLLPSFPGALNGATRANSRSQHGPNASERRGIAFQFSTGVDIRGNFADWANYGAGAFPNGANLNAFQGLADLHNFDVLKANFPVPDPAVAQNYPATKAEAIARARPLAGSVAARSGCGALAEVGKESEDYYNFGQHPAEPLGYRMETPWYPIRLQVTAASGGFSASWAAPAPIHGAITGYAVEYSVNGGSFTSLAGYGGTALTAAYSGGSAGQSIVVRVRATNANGNGPWMVAAAVTAT